MITIGVVCNVPIYDQQTEQPGSEMLSVLSHWGRNDVVYLATPSGESFLLHAGDLIKAVKNAVNTNQ